MMLRTHIAATRPVTWTTHVWPARATATTKAMTARVAVAMIRSTTAVPTVWAKVIAS
jgi:hypothetical protein